MMRFVSASLLAILLLPVLLLVLPTTRTLALVAALDDATEAHPDDAVKKEFAVWIYQCDD
jgi:hypothetical protein